MFAALFFAQAIAQTPSAAPSQEAMHDYFSCLVEKAREADTTHATTAAGVAAVVMTVERACPAEFNRWKEAFVAEAEPGLKDDAGYVADTSRASQALKAFEAARHITPQTFHQPQD